MDVLKRKFELQVEIDYWHYVLGQMLEQSKKPKSPIEIMIDESSGFTKEKIKEANKIIKKVRILKKEFYAI